MSRLKAEAPEGPAVTTATTASQDAEEKLPRWQRRSSFATRKAQADANIEALAQRRVVSLGQTEYTQRNLKTGEIELLDAELFYDLDHPRTRWIEIDGVAGQYMLDSGGEPEKVTKLPPLRNGMPRGPSPSTPLSLPDPPPRAV